MRARAAGPNRSRQGRAGLPLSLSGHSHVTQHMPAPQHGRPNAGPMFSLVPLASPGSIPHSPAGDKPCLRPPAPSAPTPQITAETSRGQKAVLRRLPR